MLSEDPEHKACLGQEAQPSKPSFPQLQHGEKSSSCSPGITRWQHVVLPRVISTESSTIIRSVGRTPQVGKPGWPCLRLWENCSPSGRGPFPVAPRPLFPPSLCWAHKHPPGQVAFPKQLSSPALSRVIHNRCCGQSHQRSRPQRSPPRGRRAQSLQSWSCSRIGTLANL